MTTAGGIPARWADILKPVSLELRLALIAELSRAGVLAAVGLDVRRAVLLLAQDLSQGDWKKAEGILEVVDGGALTKSPLDGWQAWTEFCARSPPTDVADYRELLEERYLDEH